MKALTLKAIACATLFAVAGLAAVPAQAASPAPASTAVTAPAGATPLVQVGHRHHGHRDWRGHRGGFTFYFGTPGPRRGHYGYCTTDRAVYKASSFGLRHPRVLRADHSVIKVRGYRHGHRVTMKIGRAPGCPVYATY